MRVKLQPPNAKDELYLIKTDKFMEIVDLNDLGLRNSQTIKNSCHSSWFDEDDEAKYLSRSRIYIKKGIAKFINGRHRTLLLTKYLKEIPMALTNMDSYPIIHKAPTQESVNALNRIMIKKLNGDEEFEFPDLPIRYLGYDSNIGK